MKKLLKYDYYYLRKTSKFIVFGAIFILFSIISPLTARYLNEILEFLLNGEDLGFPIPETTVFTAYSQYIGDLYEIVFTVTLFVGVSIFIRDKTKDLQPLIFSKPINRTKYILSKYISFTTMLLGCVLLGNIVFSYYTYLLFDEVFVIKGIYISLMYFLDLMFVCAIALFSATHFKGYIPAMLVTWGIYIFSGIINLLEDVPFVWEVLKYFPSRIQANMGNILMDVADYKDIILNVLVVLGFIAVFLGFTIRKIRNQDI
ncbi:ABC-2 family transporter protein [Candidatus Izimaplasma bacterium HR1]|uniref:ABC transporter permease n=1 Tax=Candidatus Izimoplasma sp. HR1 TaxID=1541959 RepID=UPI0004F5AAA9|nr:ABC-2 family transporter protein [Candidatus Izimaplasma bacterium HR1]